MASKNRGAGIQRANSDGAFRRQLQSDPAAALRGFNLSPDEVAAIRSGDSGKLVSLGVDQRMSKAFTVGGGFLGATRSTTSDLGSGSTSSTIASDNTAGTREGIVGDPTMAGVRMVNDIAPFGTPGTSAIEDPNATEFGRAAVSTGDLSGTRAVNDVAPFGASGTSAIEDATSPEYAASQHAGDLSSARGINDVAPFGTTGTSAVEDASSPEGRSTAIDASSGSAGSAVVNDPYSGQYQGVSPDFEASVSSHMADAGDATSIRSVNDVAPFEGNVNAITADADAMLGDARLDPGIDSSQADTLSNTGETGDEHGWG